MTATEFLQAHQANQQRDVPFTSLPFYRWLTEYEPRGSFVFSLAKYYGGHNIRGAFTEDEITTYRDIFNEFWRNRHEKEKAG